jgi:hypothetical protein
MLSPMALHTFELADPQRLMDDLAARVPLSEDTAYVALVRDPSTHQELLDVRSPDLPALVDDDESLSEHLREVARAFAIPDGLPVRHLLVTILVRPGRCIFGPNEAVWLAGWRYANHFQRAFDGALFLVTEHGWHELMSDDAGREPRLTADRTQVANHPSHR